MKNISLLIIIILALFSCKSKPKEQHGTDSIYTCSMDPQVIEYKPGKCPICKMDLTPVKKSNGDKKDEIMLSAQQVQLGNIQTDSIRSGQIGKKIVLTATLNFDQTKTSSVSSRVMGRVERLYFKNIGDYVKKGSLLFDLYSEELNNAKQEYLLALERKQAFAKESAIDFGHLLQSAKNKLLLWGMSEAQVGQLEKDKKASPLTSFYSPAQGYITTLDIREGEYVMEGGTIVRLSELSSLWAEAQVYTSQMGEIDRSGNATVQVPDFAGAQLVGKIQFVNPEINPATRINLVRISIPNPGNKLKPGMPAYVILKNERKTGFILPLDAVIREAKGTTVWVKTGPHTFRSKMVETGLETDEGIEIKSGLEVGDIVVISGAYLLQSEYIFKKGSDPMTGHAH